MPNPALWQVNKVNHIIGLSYLNILRRVWNACMRSPCECEQNCHNQNNLSIWLSWNDFSFWSHQFYRLHSIFDSCVDNIVMLIFYFVNFMFYRTTILKRFPRLNLPLQAIVCTAAFAFALPLAISLFPQMSEVSCAQPSNETLSHRTLPL